MINLQTELKNIEDLSPTIALKLKRLGISSVKDLIFNFPNRYEDFSNTIKIAQLKPNELATISGEVKKIDIKRTWKRKMIIVEALIVDDSGAIKALWFNQPYIGKILKIDSFYNFSGKLSSGGKEPYFSNPSYEPSISKSEIKHTAGLIPIYSETRGLTSRGIRYVLKPILSDLEELKEFIPEEILSSNKIPEINSAIRKIHFPKNKGEIEIAKKRFSFENIFLLELNNIKTKLDMEREKAHNLGIEDSEIEHLIKKLPFELTKTQTRSLYEIIGDLNKNHPMNRLLEGDVGSGKTIIIAIAAILTAQKSKQVALMAPTEVLAMQHLNTFKKVFGTYLKQEKIGVGILTSGLKQKDKKEIKEKIISGEIKIIIGTHSLIQKDLIFNDLGLIIIDEQHRFGIEQRGALVKSEISHANETNKILPHFLSMSATPIPRTLALTLFGDLELSIIDELPKGRKPIITKLVSGENRSKAYGFIKEKVKEGRQVFVVCPRIEKSKPEEEKEKSPENKWKDAKTIEEEYEKLSKNIFPEFSVGFIHGKIKSDEKERIMKDFKENKIQILIATSLIEVGIDIPNATIMIIEGSEYFGLSQLYQLRGRIGRGEHQSFCLLFSDSKSATSNSRLNALIKAKNGFELAEIDLKLRGPGEILGDKQTGLPDLAMEALSDIKLIKSVRDSVIKILKKDRDLENYPNLRNKINEFQKQIHLE
ncbi:MAG: ATP-dependent DNA helicase RecG [Candidatus Pacebacteria bacterium]|nr:ATP-dependent DNA helicase RecG [Candidatus Paceibacterota bacterium]